jgi:hypothetical protein
MIRVQLVVRHASFRTKDVETRLQSSTERKVQFVCFEATPFKFSLKKNDAFDDAIEAIEPQTIELTFRFGPDFGFVCRNR